MILTYTNNVVSGSSVARFLRVCELYRVRNWTHLAKVALVPEEALELAHDARDYEEGELAGEVEARLRRPRVDGGHQEALVPQQPQAEVEAALEQLDALGRGGGRSLAARLQLVDHLGQQAVVVCGV